MENQGSAGVITLESLMNAAPLPIEDSLGSKEALENEMNSGEEVLPGLSDLKPLSERTLVLKKHMMSVKEYYSKFSPAPFTFKKRFLTFKKLKEKKEKKCPFGFGK